MLIYTDCISLYHLQVLKIFKYQTSVHFTSGKMLLKYLLFDYTS